MEKVVQLLIFIFSCTLLQAQQVNEVIGNIDTIHIKRSLDGTNYYVHKIKKGENLFRLSKFFNLKVRDLYDFNPGIENTILDIGQVMMVPLNTEDFVYYINPAESDNYIPLSYKVRTKDNLFRLARIYFDQSISAMSDRNNLNDTNLSIGQNLIIGYYPKRKGSIERPKEPTMVLKKVISKKEMDQVVQNSNPSLELDQIKPEEEVIISEVTPTVQSDSENKQETTKIDPEQMDDPSSTEKVEVETSPDENVVVGNEENTIILQEEVSDEENSENEDELEEDKSLLILKQSRGLAIWKKNSADTENYYALHPTASVGTIIEITNPMLERKVNATVVGNLQPDTYPSNISLVITPRVAKELGMLDSRALVTMKFYELKSPELPQETQGL